MASKKLKKYLAYYQKVLKGDPENIEARLRLAAIFREMGRHSHAVEEYVSASKLLAKEGLPLEAIAACKAVLELDSTHTEIQYFLARLYAQVPEATGNVARIAQPVGEEPSSAARTVANALGADYDDVDEEELDDAMITLQRPKGAGEDEDDEPETRNVDVLAEVWNPREKETRRSNAIDSIPSELEEATDADDAVEEDDEEVTVTREMDPVDRASLRPRPDEFFGTQDLDPKDILEEMPAPDYEVRTRQSTSTNVSVVSREVLASDEPTETIELSIFDMDSLDLDSGDFEDFDFDEEFGDIVELEYETGESRRPAILSVSRSELPEIPLFSQLAPEVFMQLLKVIDLRKVSMGGPILEPGMRTRSLFVIVRGETAVWREIDGERIELATMSEGDFFGEFRLLTGRDGKATVSAKTDVDLLEISEDVVNTLGDAHPEIWDVLWDFYYQRMLNNLLASSQMFRPLDHDERSELASKFTIREIVSGQYLLRENDTCEYVYLVLSGEVSVERDLGSMKQGLAEMREGEFFGVASSLGGDPYPADVRAVRDTTLLCLASEDFITLVDENSAVAKEVQRVIRSRRQMNAAFSSGITPYGELGIANLE